MSLLNQNSSWSTRDYLFIATGLLGLVCFFTTYRSQDPRSMVDMSRDRAIMVSEAASWADALGFNSADFRIVADVGFNVPLMDSLQSNMGREEAIAQFSGAGITNLYPYYWEANFNRDGQGEGALEGDPGAPGPANAELTLRFSPQGDWIELINESLSIPPGGMNSEALRAVFSSGRLGTAWEAIPDSSLGDIFRFDIVRGYSNSSSEDTAPVTRRMPYLYTRDELLSLASFYIDRSGWILDQFEIIDIELETIRSVGVAHLEYASLAPILGQDVFLRASVTSSGALLELTGSYNETTPAPNGGGDLWQLVLIVLLFLFGTGAVIIFYNRIRARVVDTKSAVIVSVLTGFLVPATIFLDDAGSINLLGGGLDLMELLGLALVMGVSGAFAAVAVFVLSAIGDSITRQYQPAKLDRYDYLRQGMFFNKPIGETLVRSVLLMFILAGSWSALLMLFPNLYAEADEVFLAYEVLWAPVYFLLENFWLSLLVIIGVFLVVGSQAYAKTKSSWFSGGATSIAFALASPLPFVAGPFFQQFLVYFLLGILLTLIFVKWDFLTLFLSYFLFACLLTVSSGWMVEGSPDIWAFITFGLILLFIATAGTISIIRGKDEQSLPDYVPDYVEELAQEERIKQELQIARDVQQSFLPVKTPAVKGLELAAVCKPAYETGGDYYDFIQLGDHRVAVAIGDVSGKGIQAAFYMTFIKGILHSLCYETTSPADLLKKANRLFFDNARRGTFISLIYGIIDTHEKTFRFARAGHNPILHVKGRDGTMELLRPNGLGLGLTIDSTFDENIEERTLLLEQGDVLLLYTDGIVESINDHHRFYGTDRLLDKLKGRKRKTAGQILTGLFSDIASFTGDARQHDDMTAMVLRMTDSARE